MEYEVVFMSCGPFKNILIKHYTKMEMQKDTDEKYQPIISLQELLFSCQEESSLDGVCERD